MPFGDYLAGLFFLTATLGACALVAALLVRRRLAHLDGSPRALALATVTTAAIVVAHLLPGLVGLLSRWTALAVALVAAGLAARVPGVPGKRDEVAPPDAKDEGLPSWLIAGAGAGAMALWLLASAWNRTVLPPDGGESLTFHLPNVASWIQSGSFWQVDQFTPLLSNGHYPHSGDVVFLATVIPWENDWLVGAVNPLFIALAATAVYAIATQLGAPRPAALLSGALFAAVPAVGLAANGEAMTDSMMLAMFGAGVLFLLRHELGAPRSELVLAGLALGLSFGTKWYAAWAVPIVVAVWLGARLVRRRPALPDGAILVCLVAVCGGFWLVRNLVESGNPVFPLDVGALGLTLVDAPRDLIRECAGLRIVDYLGDGGAWSDHIVPALRDLLGWPGAALALGWLGAAVLAARGMPALTRGPLVVGVACAGLLAIGYALTPYSAFGPEGEPDLTSASVRYLTPALLVAAPLLAVAVARAGRLRVPLEVLMVVAIAFGIEREFEVRAGVVAAVAAALGASALAGWVVLALAQRAGPRARLVQAAAVVAALGALVAAGHARQREFNEAQYSSDDAVIQYVDRHAQDGHRIALAGVWREERPPPVWPAFGERLGNEVAYLGPTVDGQLREYDRRAEWSAALRRGRHDLLIVGRGGYAASCPVPGEESDDDRWARDEGFEPLARSDRLTLYRVR